MYRVESRYEAYVREGLVFTKWFTLQNGFETESDADQFIKKYKKSSVNPKMNRKEEFRIIEI